MTRTARPRAPPRWASAWCSGNSGRAALQLRGPEGGAISAAALGGIERLVGRLEQGFPGLSSERKQRSTDRAGDLDRSELAVKRRGFELAADALGKQHRASLVGLLAHDHEFFPAEATHRVGVALHALEHVCEALDHDVAHVVSVGIIDALEVVDIANQERQRLLEALGA